MKDNLRVSPNSPYYPYNKVYEGFFNLSSTLDIPRKVMDYILDMPDGLRNYFNAFFPTAGGSDTTWGELFRHFDSGLKSVSASDAVRSHMT